ncbi:hypothetical protein Plhal304r1_c054g0139661 [Plasmopara halstedii]
MKKLYWLWTAGRQLYLTMTIATASFVPIILVVQRYAKCACTPFVLVAVSLKSSAFIVNNRSSLSTQRHLCVRCLLAAMKADALQVAAEQIRCQVPTIDLYDVSTRPTSSSKMVSPRVQTFQMHS